MCRHRWECPHCGEPHIPGTVVVFMWDVSNDVHMLHHRCARALGLTWLDLPRMAWKKLTRRRWEGTICGKVYEIIWDAKRTKKFACIKDATRVYDLQDCIRDAKRRSELEAIADIF